MRLPITLELFLRITRGYRVYLWAVAVLVVLSTVGGSVSLLALLPVLEVAARSIGSITALNNAADYSIVTQLFINTFDFLGIPFTFNFLCAVLIALFFVKGAIHYSGQILSTAFSQNLARNWMVRICGYYVHVPYDSVSGIDGGEIISNMRREPLRAAKFIKDFIQFNLDAAIGLSVLVSLLVVDWRIVSAVLGVMLILRLFGWGRLYRVIRRLGERNISLARMNERMIQEVSLALKEIRIFSIQDRELGKVDATAANLNHNKITFKTLNLIPTSFAEFFGVFVGGCIILFIVNSNPGNAATLLAEGTFMLVGFNRLINMGAKLASTRMNYLNRLPSARTLDHLLTEVQTEGRTEVETGVDGSLQLPDDPMLPLEIKSVSFAYDDGKAVLKGVDLSVWPGKIIYLVGASGAGKSTLIELMLRLYSPTEGTIAYGGKSSIFYDLHEWRNAFGYVRQSPVLFTGTLRDNVLLGRHKICSDRELDHIARVSGLDTVLQGLPDGWDTHINALSSPLSFGQTKRLMIARAIAGRPRFLIFDEATTAIEEKLEAEMLNQLHAAFPNIAIIVVSHRLSSIGLADEVVYLQDGMIKAQGGVDELSPVLAKELAAPAALP